MPYIDPDTPNPRLIAELARSYEEAARRLKEIVLNPPGRSLTAQMYNEAHAASRLAKVQAEIDRLKKTAADWTGTALQESFSRGLSVADQQIKDAGLSDNSAFSVAGGQNSAFRGSFTMVDRKAVEVLAQIGRAHV